MRWRDSGPVFAPRGTWPSWDLMLLQGLRSQEVLDLNRDDLLLPEAQIRVRGKGNKTRFLPLAPEAAQLLDHYLRLERPTDLDQRFVCFSQRPRSRRPDDTRGFTLTVSPSSSDHRRQDGQPAPVPPHLRLRYGARRRQPAGPHAVDGTRANPDHDGLCAGHSSGGLSAVCASGGAAHQARTGDPVVKLSRYAPLEHPLAHQFQRAVESLTAALSSGLSPSIPWHRARLPDLSGRASSCRLFVKSVAPRPAYPRLVCPSALPAWRRRSTSLACCVCAASWRNLPGPHSFPIWLI